MSSYFFKYDIKSRTFRAAAREVRVNGTYIEYIILRSKKTGNKLCFIRSEKPEKEQSTFYVNTENNLKIEITPFK